MGNKNSSPKKASSFIDYLSIFSCSKGRSSRSQNNSPTHEEIIISRRSHNSEDDLAAVAIMESLEAFKIPPQNSPNSSRQNPDPRNLGDSYHFRLSAEPPDPRPLASV